MQISGAQLKKIFPKLDAAIACEIATKFNEILPLYGMDDADIFHEYIARVGAESGEMLVLEESFNYSVEALINKFGRHRISIEQANKYGRKVGQKANKKAIANTIYGGEFGRKHLGNTQPSDGWDMRGRGPLQITGRTNYTLFTSYYNNRVGTSYTIIEMAELIGKDYHFAIHSSCWVFAIAKKLIPYAISDSLKTIVKKINGGLIGYEDTEKYYKRAVKYIPEV